MSRPPKYCALILTHGRPDNVRTVQMLERHGYTGPWWLVVDDEDPTLDDYIDRYGTGRVRVFSKTGIAAQFDEGDNRGDRRCIVYARNAAYDIAADLGYRYFMQLDDDYYQIRYRFNEQREFIRRGFVWNLDVIFGELVRWYASTPPAVGTVAIGQGGDYLGGAASGTAGRIYAKRKAMNSFVCDTERRITFLGRLNEDVSAYTATQRRGTAFLTVLQVFLDQFQTQSNDGGMTDLYRAQGTYVKSFYSVMHCPSAVRVTMMGPAHPRVHHRVNYDACAPKILRPTP
jgi:hypothetical protein